MIVVDTNIIVYLYLPTEFTEQAEQLLKQEPVWAAPILWRSEFRDVLGLYLRRNLIDLNKALQLQSEAESLIKEHEYTVSSYDVIRLMQDSNCSAYDCEFVALASTLNATLITQDRGILREFPSIAVSIAAYVI